MYKLIFVFVRVCATVCAWLYVCVCVCAHVPRVRVLMSPMCSTVCLWVCVSVWLCAFVCVTERGTDRVCVCVWVLRVFVCVCVYDSVSISFHCVSLCVSLCVYRGRCVSICECPCVCVCCTCGHIPNLQATASSEPCDGDPSRHWSCSQANILWYVKPERKLEPWTLNIKLASADCCSGSIKSTLSNPVVCKSMHMNSSPHNYTRSVTHAHMHTQKRTRSAQRRAVCCCRPDKRLCSTGQWILNIVVT